MYCLLTKQRTRFKSKYTPDLVCNRKNFNALNKPAVMSIHITDWFLFLLLDILTASKKQTTPEQEM